MTRHSTPKMMSPLAAMAVLSLVVVVVVPSSRPDAVASAFSAPPSRSAASARRRAEPSIVVGASRSAMFATRGAAGDGNGKKKGGGGEKKRRFLQQAHPVPPKSAGSRERPSGGGRRANGAADDDPGSLAGGGGSATAANDGSKRRGPPLQTGKSIEELESILERRWGTAQTRSNKGQKKAADVDFVLSFGGEDEFEDSPVPKSNLKGAAVFRGNNRVMDPWAKEEGIYDAVAAEKIDKSAEKGGDDERPAKQQRRVGYDRQEAILNRVRSNQKRLQSDKRGGGRRGKGREERDSRDDYYSVPVDVSRDFYDEDDEGYEGRNGSGDGRRNSLISPRPVGGKGSFSKSSSSLSGGIFSDRSSIARGADGRRERRSRVDAAVSEGDDERRKKRPKRPQSKPLLDEDGDEMFLTLEQAEKIVRNILSFPSVGSGEDAAEDFREGSRWEDVGITDPTLLSNLQSSRMSCPAPLAVQDRACPPIVAGNDVLVSTHTGSGKTLAFLAPVAQTLLMDGGGRTGTTAFPRAVVVAPGRELASQIVSVAQALFEGTGLGVSLAIGGTPYSRNVENLRKKKPDVVVGTPGRIAELVIGRPGDKGGKMKISGLQTIVLDEFDALLQYDAHKEPTVAIMEAVDRQHGRGGSLQRVLCSATASDVMTSSLEGRGESNIIEDYLRPGYAHASVDENDLLVTSGVETKTKGNVSKSARVSRTTIHGTLHVPHKRLALEAVRRILNTDPSPQQALIFVDNPRRVDIVIEKLAKMDIVAAPLSGSGGKGDRAQVSRALREGYVGVVVATELAARGIDAPYLTHVINLDLPTDASHYAHRAGRCGRGGRPGVAVSVTCDVRERGVPGRFGEELGIDVYDVEARGGKLRIVEGR